MPATTMPSLKRYIERAGRGDVISGDSRGAAQEHAAGVVIWRRMPTHFTELFFSVWVTVILTYKARTGSPRRLYWTVDGGSDDSNTQAHAWGACVSWLCHGSCCRGTLPRGPRPGGRVRL